MSSENIRVFVFVSSIFNLLRISVNRNFYSCFIVHFSFYHIKYDVAQQLWIKNAANVGRLNKRKATFILWLNERTLTVCKHTRVSTEVSRANRCFGLCLKWEKRHWLLRKRQRMRDRELIFSTPLQNFFVTFKILLFLKYKVFLQAVFFTNKTEDSWTVHKYRLPYLLE